MGAKTSRMSIEDEAMAMFNAADKNNDNLLSHTELKKYMRRERWARTLLTGDDFHWMDFFGEMDTDADGRIQPEEFVNFYKNRLKPLIDEANAMYEECKARCAEVQSTPAAAPAEATETNASSDDPLDAAFEKHYRKIELERVFRSLQRSKTDVLTFRDIVNLASAVKVDGQEWTAESEAAMYEMFKSSITVTESECYEQSTVTEEWFVEYFIQYWHGGCAMMTREDFDEATNRIFDKVLPGRWLEVTSTMNAVDSEGKVVGTIQILSDDTKIQTCGNVKIQTNPDGSKIQSHMDTGVRIQTNVDGTTIQTNSDGTTIQKTPDGCQIDLYADGRRLQTNADGTQINTPAPEGAVHHAASSPVRSTVFRATAVTTRVQYTKTTTVTKLTSTSSSAQIVTSHN